MCPARSDISTDIVYLNLGGTSKFGDDVISGAADVGFSIMMTTLAGNYRFYETADSYVDVIGGIRITDVDVDLTLNLNINPGPGPGLNIHRKASDGDTWVDPVIGVKGRHNLNENWYLMGSAIYGGFGVSSHHLYDVSGFVGYEWNNGIELYGGWRIAETNYDNGSFEWDMTMSGPMLGLTFKF